MPPTPVLCAITCQGRGPHARELQPLPTIHNVPGPLSLGPSPYSSFCLGCSSHTPSAFFCVFLHDVFQETCTTLLQANDKRILVTNVNIQIVGSIQVKA